MKWKTDFLGQFLLELFLGKEDRTKKWMDGWQMDGWMNKWMDGCIDKWMDG